MRKEPALSKEPAPRGRPKKRPDYDWEQEYKLFVEQVVEKYAFPYDDRRDRPADAPSINYVAQEMGLSRYKVRKILVTAGFYSTAESREIQRLRDRGYTLEEISSRTGLTPNTINSLLPYGRGTYNLDNPSLNAESCKKYRRRNEARERLSSQVDSEDILDILWEAFDAFEQYPFRMKNGRRIRYSIIGRRLCIDGVVYPWLDIVEAYLEIRKIRRKGGVVKREDCSCCEELYTIFLRIGACN